jgi:hypothetical protein
VGRVNVDAALPPLPPRFDATRDALHRLAVYVVAPTRRAATGNEIALAATPGGFGTPDEDRWGQVCVEQTELVVVRAGSARRAPIRSLRDAARLTGIELELVSSVGGDVPDAGDPDAELAVDAAAATVLARWFAFAWDVLAELKGRFGSAEAPSPVHLWPEHFDVAVDAGVASRGRRATWGLSPGDGLHPEPYAYVSRWTAAPEDAFWTETAFSGISLSYQDLRSVDDPRARVLAFFEAAHRQLTRTG